MYPRPASIDERESTDRWVANAASVMYLRDRSRADSTLRHVELRCTAFFILDFQLSGNRYAGRNLLLEDEAHRITRPSAGRYVTCNKCSD